MTTKNSNDNQPNSDAKSDCKAKDGCCCFCTLIAIVAFVNISIIILIPVPKPTFILNDVKLYTFNLSSTLTSNLLITISSKNEDDGTAFHFDKLDVFASYRSQQITLPTMIPPSYLHVPDVTVWSPSVNGTEVPLTPEHAVSLAQDETAGTVLINVMVTGRLSWKYSFYSLHCGLKVNCPAYVMFGNNNNNNINDSNIIGSAVKHPFGHEGCDTDVGKVKY